LFLLSVGRIPPENHGIPDPEHLNLFGTDTGKTTADLLLGLEALQRVNPHKVLDLPLAVFLYRLRGIPILDAPNLSFEEPRAAVHLHSGIGVFEGALPLLGYRPLKLGNYAKGNGLGPRVIPK